MAFDHSNCSHPRTPAGRRGCRKAGGPTEDLAVAFLAPVVQAPDVLRTLADVQALARAVMDEHGLHGWRFRFDSAARRFGRCHYGLQLITMSRRLIEANLFTNPDQIRDTLLHEVAHALTPGAKHGPAWQAMARKLGAKPTALYAFGAVTQVPGPYKATCPNCGHTAYKHRRPGLRPRACSLCCNQYNGGRFDARFILNYEKS